MKTRKFVAGQKLLSLVAIIAVIVAHLVYLGVSNQVEAAGVQVYADLSADAGGTPSTITTQPVFADGTATEVFFSYTATSAFVNGDEVKLTFPTGVTIANTCTTPTTDADGDTTGDGSASVNGQQYTYSFTGAATASVEFCVDVTASDADAENYSVALSSTNDNDYGAVLIYAYDDSTPAYQNQVEITAQVAPILQLSITDTADAETDLCDLGVLDVISVNTCQYRVYPGTNQTSGTATLSFVDVTNAMTSNLDGLSKGTTADTDDIDATTANTDVAGGTEGTGVTFIPTGTTFALQGNYNDTTNAGDDPVPTTEATLAQASGYIDGTVGSGNYLTATHSGAADAGTQTGSYTGWVQYLLVSTP
jgi:hypothetical protein